MLCREVPALVVVRLYACHRMFCIYLLVEHNYWKRAHAYFRLQPVIVRHYDNAVGIHRNKHINVVGFFLRAFIRIAKDDFISVSECFILYCPPYFIYKDVQYAWYNISNNPRRLFIKRACHLIGFETGFIYSSAYFFPLFRAYPCCAVKHT